MTFSSYFSAMIDVTGIRQVDFVISFFEAAGYVQPDTNKYETIPESTVRSWFKTGKGHRDCELRDYFKSGIITAESLYGFLKETINENWSKLQERYRTEDHGNIDIYTTSQKVFLHSLINEFQSFGKLRYTYFEDEQTTADEELHVELTLEQLRDSFVECINHYAIMEIINRNPPKLTRNDATAMSNFADSIDSVIGKCKQTTDILYTSIKNFKNEIQITELVLCANLNSRFSFQDPNAVYNMEEDDTAATRDTTYRPGNVPEIEDNHNSFTPSSIYTSIVKFIKKLSTWKTNNSSDNHLKNRLRRLGLPELTPEFVQAFAEENPDKPDSIRYLAGLGVKTWQDTLNKLNNWYNDILKWKKSSHT